MRLLEAVAALALLALATSVSAASPRVVVATPAAGAEVDGDELERVTVSIRRAAADLSVVEQSGADVLTPAQARHCAIEAPCLAAIGSRAGAERIVGVLVERDDHAVAIGFVLVDVATVTALVRDRYVLDPAELDTAPGTRLIEFLLLAGEEVGAAPAPPTDVATELPPPAPPVAPVEAPTPRRWRVGARVGAVIPRSEPQPGFVLGARGEIAIDAADRVRAVVGVDWVTRAGTSSELLSPPSYPRSMATLAQRSSLVTAAVGASVRIARLGSISLRGGAAIGVQVGRTRFEAFGMRDVQSITAPAGTIEVAALGAAGPLIWRVSVGWHEARGEPSVGSAYDEPMMSGFMITTGADW